MDNMQNMGGGKMVCGCAHHKVVPVFVILFGVTFLLGYWGTISWSMVNTIWPVLVILGGIMKLMDKGKMCKCC